MKFTLKGAIKKIKKTIGITTSKPKAKKSHTSSSKKPSKKDDEVKQEKNPIVVDVAPKAAEVKVESSPAPITVAEVKEPKEEVAPKATYTSEQLAWFDKIDEDIEDCIDFDEILSLREEAKEIGLEKEFYEKVCLSEEDFNRIEDYMSGKNYMLNIYDLDEIYGLIEDCGLPCIQDKLYDIEEDVKTKMADDREFIDPERIENIDYDVISSCGFNLYLAYESGNFEDMVKAYDYDSDDTCVGDIHEALKEKEPSAEEAIPVYEKYNAEETFSERLSELYFELGKICEHKRDIESAVKNYQKAIDYGNEDAQARLNEMYGD